MVSPTTATSEIYKKTLQRIEKIQSHLKSSSPGTRLKGKVCIITGVGSLKGIGRATALLFAHEGAEHLYLLDFQGENLPNLKETIQKQYPSVKCTIQQADATDEEAISSVCQQALDEEGRLDVFFANAGVATISHLRDLGKERFMETMKVNALSVFLAIKHASAAMEKTCEPKGKTEGGGSILVTASVAGINSGAGSLDYSASKAAVNNMAKTAAWQLARTNIRVNSLCPGLIETGMTEFQFKGARQRGTEAKLGQLNPLGRYGVAEEIAQAALFLASDESSYVNGHNFSVDGGLTASMPVIPGKLA